MTFTLSEKLMLLALKDEKGTVVFSASTALPYGLTGAVLFDLIFMKRIALDDEKNIRLQSHESTGYSFLDDGLSLIAREGKTHPVKHWIDTFQTEIHNLQDQIIKKLVEKNILNDEEHRILWVFPAHRYPTRNPGPEHALRQHIANVAVNDHEPNPEDIALLSLVKVCSLTDEVFPHRQRKKAAEQISTLTKDQPIAKVIQETLDEITLAIMGITTSSTII